MNIMYVFLAPTTSYGMRFKLRILASLFLNYAPPHTPYQRNPSNLKIISAAEPCRLPLFDNSFGTFVGFFPGSLEVTARSKLFSIAARLPIPRYVLKLRPWKISPEIVYGQACFLTSPHVHPRYDSLAISPWVLNSTVCDDAYQISFATVGWW